MLSTIKKQQRRPRGGRRRDRNEPERSAAPVEMDALPHPDLPTSQALQLHNNSIEPAAAIPGGHKPRSRERYGGGSRSRHTQLTVQLQLNQPTPHGLEPEANNPGQTARTPDQPDKPRSRQKKRVGGKSQRPEPLVVPPQEQPPQTSAETSVEHELGGPVPPEQQHQNRHRKRGRGRGRGRGRQLQDGLRADPNSGVEAQSQTARGPRVERDHTGTVPVVNEDRRRRSRGSRPRKNRSGPAAPSLEAPALLPKTPPTSDTRQPQGTSSHARAPRYPRMDRRAVASVQQLLRGARDKRASRVRFDGVKARQRSNTARRESDASLPKVDDDATDKEPTALAHDRSPSTIPTGIMKKSSKKPVKAVSNGAVSVQAGSGSEDVVSSGDKEVVASPKRQQQQQRHDARVAALSPPDVRPAPQLPTPQLHEGKNEKDRDDEGEEQSPCVGLVDAFMIVRGQTTSPLLQDHMVMLTLEANGGKPVEEDEKKDAEGSVASHDDVVVEDIFGAAVGNTKQASTALVLTPRTITSRTTFTNPTLSVAEFISLLQPRAVMRGLCFTAQSIDVVVCCPAGPRSGLAMPLGSMGGALVPSFSVWPTAEGRVRLSVALNTMDDASVPLQPGKMCVDGVNDHTKARPRTMASKFRARFGGLCQVPRVCVRSASSTSRARAATGTREDASEPRFQPRAFKSSIVSALRRCLPRGSAVGSGLSSVVTPPSSSSDVTSPAHTSHTSSPTAEHTIQEAFTRPSQTMDPEAPDAWIDELLACPVEALKPKTKPSIVKRVRASFATALRARVKKGTVKGAAHADPLSPVDDAGEGQEPVIRVSCWGFLCGTSGHRL